MKNLSELSNMCYMSVIRVIDIDSKSPNQSKIYNLFGEHLSDFSDTCLTFSTCVVECHISVEHRNTPTPGGVRAS